jgi:nitroimidazol reductase NimA-like FMN-containing flavoprotein (pyridoxamine 5'-phosphate oxidase superfamily)
MTPDEIDQVIKAAKWASIMTVQSDGRPYAIEATPFEFNGEIRFMINPGGGTSENIKTSSQVLLKYTLTTPDLAQWIGVSCFGQGRFVDDPEEIRSGWQLLGLVTGEDYSRAAERFSVPGKRTPLFSVTIEEKTGRCSAAIGQPLPPLV